jgi:hypothetical protein
MPAKQTFFSRTLHACGIARRMPATVKRFPGFEPGSPAEEQG